MRALADENRTLPGVLSRVLTACTALAGAVGLLGVVMLVVKGRGGAVSLREFTPAAEGLRHPGSIVRAALGGDALAVMQCAVVVLIATPVLRVVASMVVFVVERDGLYVVMSVLVLAGLAVGLLGWVG